jgi:hypothetical protein
VSEHAKHFVPGGTGQLIPVPEFGCRDCAARLGPVIDWPARFRAAADVADDDLFGGDVLRMVASMLERWPAHVVEAIGRALLGETKAEPTAGDACSSCGATTTKECRCWP